MSEAMSTLPAQAEKNYVPWVVGLASVGMGSIVLIMLFREGDNMPVVGVLFAMVNGIVLTLMGLTQGGLQRQGLATHRAVNSVVAKFVETTEDAARAAKIASEAAVEAASAMGRAAGIAEQQEKTAQSLAAANEALMSLAAATSKVVEQVAADKARLLKPRRVTTRGK